MRIDKINNKTNVDTFFKTPHDFNVDSKKVSFSFENFNGNSVINTRINYNSHYQNIESSRNAISDFFNIISQLSKYKIGELMSSRQLKDEYHIDKFNRNNHIERIETVLKEDYSYPQGKIDEFDKEYYEFQISDGKRVIWHKVDNIINPLFIDCNHMICIDFCRGKKAKMTYNEKSSFSHFNEVELNKEDLEISDSIKMIIESYENGEELDSEDIIEFLKEIIHY